MKRIVLLTDPDRLDTFLVERLQRIFPECDLEIVAVADDRRTTAPSGKRTGRRRTTANAAGGPAFRPV